MELTKPELRELLIMHLKSVLGAVATAEPGWVVEKLQRLLAIANQLERTHE